MHGDAEAPEALREQGVGAAVQRAGGDDFVAGVAQRQDRQRFRKLTRRRRQRADATFERGNALLKHVVGRVHDAGVDVARFLQREQRRRVIGVAELVRGRLVERDGARAGRRVGRIAGVQGQRVEL